MEVVGSQLVVLAAPVGGKPPVQLPFWSCPQFPEDPGPGVGAGGQPPPAVGTQICPWYWLEVGQPFSSWSKMTWPTTAILSVKVKLLPPEARNRFPLVWTRPPKLKLGP